MPIVSIPLHSNALQKNVWLILFCGLPGTGKTTAAKKLSKSLHYELVDQAEIRRRHGFRKMPKTQEKVLREIDRIVAYYLLYGTGVIFESGNRYTFRRQQMYGIASGAGARVLVIECICPEDLSKQRMQARLATQDGLLADPRDPRIYDDIKRWWEPVPEDFAHAGSDHVSYIQFDSGRMAVEKQIVRRGTSRLIKKIERCLLLP